MRRAIISIILLFSLLSVVSTTASTPLLTPSNPNLDYSPTNNVFMSEISKSGNNVPVIQYLNRSYVDQLITISNSFALPDTHGSTIDLSSYQIPGWTLVKVIIDPHNITAITEREIVGTSTSPIADTELEIYEHSADVYYDQLAQGFYNMSHDGQLQNISLLYMCPSYDPSNQNYAYIDIRSDYQDGSTNMVSSVQLENVGFTPTWANVTESVILDANNVYYTVMNGTNLIEVFNSYPEIRWNYEDDAGAYLTRRHNTDGDTWGSDRPNEAIMNYTYIPWNKTSSSALVYSDPVSIDTMVNGTPVTGSSWVLSSVNNITSFPITTNQSVNVYYNLTLCYTDDNVGSTVWRAAASGDPIGWNVSSDLSFPAVSNVVGRGMDITNIPLDWAGTGLYLGAVSAGSYSKSGTNVTCTGLSDGTWTYTSTAPNYAVDLSLFDTSDDSAIPSKVANTVTIDANATIEDGGGTPQTGGTANLSILQSSTLIYSPTEKPASAGTADFQWDISATTNGNTTHSVEVHWISTNGLEAGYITQEVFVYHSTTLVADDMTIVALTEDSFAIGINFEKVSPAQGLETGTAAVTYSFGSTVNDSMTDDTGGRWTFDVDTTGMENGLYPLTVYAEGFALENQSLVIMVNLNHQTRALNLSWSNTNNIAYLESTNLSVTYRYLFNETRIDGATVNVTFQGSTYDMAWDSATQTYWIELTGANFTGVPGTFPLTVSAWKAGFESQINGTETITIGSQTGEVFSVDYNPSTLNISYIETLFIQVTYNYSSIPIDSNTVVRITFNGSSPVDLVYNVISMTWETTLVGSNYLGAWDIIVRATADGYTTRQNSTTFIVREDIAILSNSWVGSSATTDYATNAPVSITLTDSIGSPINDATVSFTAFSTLYSSSVGIAGVYTFSIDPNETRGIESFTVTVVRTGYVISQMNLNLTVEATTSLTLSHTSSEYEEWDITIEAAYMDTYNNTPITDALVNITLDGTLYILQYVDGVYAVNITLNIAPNIIPYTINAYASAQYTAYATDQSTLTVNAKEDVYIEIEFAPPQVQAGQFMEVRATLWSNVTDDTIAGIEILFEISIYYQNGTIIHYSDASMTDVTNLEGVATYGFDVPEGQIEKLSATASYIGSRTRWNTETTKTTGVSVSILALVMSFLTSDIGLMIILSIAVLGIVAAGYNRGVKPKKKAAKRGLENQLQMFKDLETVQHFMAVYLDRGTCVFYHPFTDERIQPDLISGFIAAITSVYGEIKGDGVRGTLEEIQYHGLRLNSYSGQYIIGILILEGEMTPLLRERLQFFVELFENQYDQDLDGWTGLIDCFDPEWVVSTLNSSFNYAWHLPHRFGPTQKVTKLDAKILDYIGAVRDERSEFYIKKIISPLGEMLEKTEAEVLDRLLLLQDRGVIIPIGIQTILQRQGLALVNGTDESIVEPPPSVDEPAVVDEAEPAEELEFEELTEEVVKEPDVDPMEAFVQDVESLLVAKSSEEKKEDNEFAKELRAKIEEDEESED